MVGQKLPMQTLPAEPRACSQAGMRIRESASKLTLQKRAVITESAGTLPLHELCRYQSVPGDLLLAGPSPIDMAGSWMTNRSALLSEDVEGGEARTDDKVGHGSMLQHPESCWLLWVPENQNHRVSSQEHFRDEAVLVDSLRSLLALPSLRHLDTNRNCQMQSKKAVR